MENNEDNLGLIDHNLRYWSIMSLSRVIRFRTEAKLSESNLYKCISLYYCLLNCGQTLIFFFPNKNSTKIKKKLQNHDPNKDPRKLLSHQLTGKGLSAFNDKKIKEITSAFYHMKELRNWINYGPDMIWDTTDSKYKIKNLVFNPSNFEETKNNIDDLILGLIEYLCYNEGSGGYRVSWLLNQCKPFFNLKMKKKNLAYYRDWSSEDCLTKCEKFRGLLVNEVEKIISTHKKLKV